MPDIDIQCPKCQKTFTVSEFVDEASLVCHNCKTPLKKPASAGKPKSKTTVKHTAVIPPATPFQTSNPITPLILAKPGTDTAQSKKVAHTPHDRTVMATTKTKIETKKGFHIPEHMVGWIIFAMLGASTAWIRYGNVASPDFIGLFDSLSPFVFLSLHVAISVATCKESVFHGIIGLLLPPFMIYHLFTMSDRFYIRGIVGGLAIGMGLPAFIYWRNTMIIILNNLDKWIHNPF